MITEVDVRKRKESLEHAIEAAIIARPEVLGFSGAVAIRNFRLADVSGAVDVLLIPRGGPIRLALIETKVALAPDAGCKVVGQLLMYYAGALTLGSQGIETLRNFAGHCADIAHHTKRISPQKVVWNVDGIDCTNREAMELLRHGKSVTPEEIALFIALDGEPHHVLQPLLGNLRERHGLNIGLVVVRNGTPTLLLPGAGQQIVGREQR
jgi:hypothetical protein